MDPVRCGLESRRAACAAAHSSVPGSIRAASASLAIAASLGSPAFARRSLNCPSIQESAIPLSGTQDRRDPDSADLIGRAREPVDGAVTGHCALGFHGGKIRTIVAGATGSRTPEAGREWQGVTCRCGKRPTAPSPQSTSGPPTPARWPSFAISRERTSGPRCAAVRVTGSSDSSIGVTIPWKERRQSPMPKRPRSAAAEQSPPEALQDPPGSANDGFVVPDDARCAPDPPAQPAEVHGEALRAAAGLGRSSTAASALRCAGVSALAEILRY